MKKTPFYPIGVCRTYPSIEESGIVTEVPAAVATLKETLVGALRNGNNSAIGNVCRLCKKMKLPRAMFGDDILYAVFNSWKTRQDTETLDLLRLEKAIWKLYLPISARVLDCVLQSAKIVKFATWQSLIISLRRINYKRTQRALDLDEDSVLRFFTFAWVHVPGAAQWLVRNLDFAWLASHMYDILARVLYQDGDHAKQHVASNILHGFDTAAHVLGAIYRRFESIEVDAGLIESMALLLARVGALRSLQILISLDPRDPSPIVEILRHQAIEVDNLALYSLLVNVDQHDFDHGDAERALASRACSILRYFFSAGYDAISLTQVRALAFAFDDAHLLSTVLDLENREFSNADAIDARSADAIGILARFCGVYIHTACREKNLGRYNNRLLFSLPIQSL
jgi:hypothetical protein